MRNISKKRSPDIHHIQCLIYLYETLDEVREFLGCRKAKRHLRKKTTQQMLSEEEKTP